MPLIRDAEAGSEKKAKRQSVMIHHTPTPQREITDKDPRKGFVEALGGLADALQE